MRPISTFLAIGAGLVLAVSSSGAPNAAGHAETLPVPSFGSSALKESERAPEDDGQPVETADDGVPIVSAEEAVRTDAAYLAKRDGVSVDAAVEAVARVEELTKHIPEVRELIGDREVSVDVEYTPRAKLNIAVSGEKSIPRLQAMAQSSDGDIAITYLDTPSIEHLQEIVDQAAAAWRENFKSFRAASVDEATNRGIYATFDGDGLPAEAELRKVARIIPEGVKLSVARHEASSARLFSRGGLILYRTSTGFADCTSGWVAAKRSTGTPILTTAGHCANDLSYIGYSQNAVGHDMNFGIYKWNTSNDAQYHYSGSASKPLFHADSRNSYRTVESRFPRTSLPSGQIVCKQGRTTGYSCGTLASIYSTWGGHDRCGASQSNPCDNVWLAITDLNSSIGDSGGPAFFGGRAIGMVVGGYQHPTTKQWYDVVTSVSLFQEALDVDVMRG